MFRKNNFHSNLETTLSVTHIFSTNSNCIIPFLSGQIIIPSVCFFIYSFIFYDCIVSYPFKFTKPTIRLPAISHQKKNVENFL